MKILQGADCLLVGPDISEIRLVQVSLEREGMEITCQRPFELPEDISQLPDADLVIADGDALPGREPEDFAAQLSAPILWLSTRDLGLDSRTVTGMQKPVSPADLVRVVREMVPAEAVDISERELAEGEAEIEAQNLQAASEPSGKSQQLNFEPEPIDPQQASAPEPDTPESEPKSPQAEAKAAPDHQPQGRQRESREPSESRPPVTEPEPEPKSETIVSREIILDVGSGSGRSTVETAEDADDTLIIGLGRSEDAIMRVRRRLGEMNVSNAAFVVADLTALPFADDQIDDVHGFEDLSGYLNTPDLSRAYAEITRVCQRQLWEESPMAAQEPQAGQDTSLSDLRANNPDIRAAALVTADGFAVEADCGPDVDEESLAALAADLLARASRSSRNFDNGRLDELYARGDEGFLVVERAGEDQVLACLASAEATIGLLLRDVRQAAVEATE